MVHPSPISHHMTCLTRLACNMTCLTARVYAGSICSHHMSCHNNVHKHISPWYEVLTALDRHNNGCMACAMHHCCITIVLSWQARRCEHPAAHVTPWTPPDTPGGASTRTATFAHPLVVLGGDIGAEVLTQRCRDVPLVIEVHDRTPIPEPAEFSLPQDPASNDKQVLRGQMWQHGAYDNYGWHRWYWH